LCRFFRKLSIGYGQEIRILTFVYRFVGIKYTPLQFSCFADINWDLYSVRVVQ
jgi:hypothetical protein